MASLAEQLGKVVKGEVFDDDATRQKYSRDASLFFVKPQAVVFPKGTADVKNLVRFVTSHPDLSLTARSAGTDMSGGPLSESIILDFTKYFTAIKEITGNHAVVEPGVYYRDFEAETLKHNLLLPSYPASRELCTVGGMAANNSGGEKTLSYGKTERYVKRLNVVLSDGEAYELTPLDREMLTRKESQKNFEGEIYRAMRKLLEKNRDVIERARPRVTKNSAGYYLWNVWDGETFDLTKLFVGSQGTLGMITEIEFELVRPMLHHRLLVIFLHDLGRLTDIIKAVLRFKPESFESFDDHTLQIALRYLPELAKLMKTKGFLSLVWRFLPEFWMTLTGGVPKLILLAEFTGETEEEAENKARAASQAIAQFKSKSRLMKTDAEARKYWVMRRESFNLLRYHLTGKRTAPFIDDIIVHPDDLPRFLPELNAILGRYPTLIYTIAGHAGDANFHIIPLMDLTNPEVRKIIPELMNQVNALVFKYRGSITAEHNDGIIRTPFLKDMFGEEVYRLFEDVKTIFDPKNIFNPGKKVNGTLAYALRHLYDGN